MPESHDISARRRVEQTLHAAEQRFRAISEGSMLGVFATGPDGAVTYFSRRATEITGVTEGDALRGRWSEHVHPDDLTQHKSQWRTAIAERKPFACERRYVRRDGGIAWARIHVAPILEGDALQGFVGTIEDINARKQADQALRASEERFSSFFSLSPVPNAVAHYPNGEYIQVNEAWERTFGYKQSEVVGKTAIELGMWDDPVERNRLYEDITRRHQARSGENRDAPQERRPDLRHHFGAGAVGRAKQADPVEHARRDRAPAHGAGAQGERGTRVAGVLPVARPGDHQQHGRRPLCWT